MASSVEVTDFLSNREEQIEAAAKTIGRGARLQVFKAIYHHKKKVKTVGEIVERTGLQRKCVLTESKLLAKKGFVRQTKKDGETAYEKIDHFDAHKAEIFKAAGDKRKIAAIPTKRKPGTGANIVIKTPSSKVDARQITIDDIQTFKRVKGVKSGSTLPISMSEEEFKRGVQSIVDEPGAFKDWGGEKSDLYTTRITVGGRRRAAAFAFKGPGLKTKLVPGKMGKNGDQAQRLFEEPAEVFLVQHWREIDPSVVTLISGLAIARSAVLQKPIWYGIIDGRDSERLRFAYPEFFKADGQ